MSNIDPFSFNKHAKDYVHKQIPSQCKNCPVINDLARKAMGEFRSAVVGLAVSQTNLDLIYSKFQNGLGQTANIREISKDCQGPRQVTYFNHTTTLCGSTNPTDNTSA